MTSWAAKSFKGMNLRLAGEGSPLRFHVFTNMGASGGSSTILPPNPTLPRAQVGEQKQTRTPKKTIKTIIKALCHRLEYHSEPEIPDYDTTSFVSLSASDFRLPLAIKKPISVRSILRFFALKMVSPSILDVLSLFVLATTGASSVDPVTTSTSDDKSNARKSAFLRSMARKVWTFTRALHKSLLQRESSRLRNFPEELFPHHERQTNSAHSGNLGATWIPSSNESRANPWLSSANDLHLADGSTDFMSSPFANTSLFAHKTQHYGYWTSSHKSPNLQIVRSIDDIIEDISGFNRLQEATTDLDSLDLHSFSGAESGEESVLICGFPDKIPFLDCFSGCADIYDNIESGLLTIQFAAIDFGAMADLASAETGAEYDFASNTKAESMTSEVTRDTSMYAFSDFAIVKSEEPEDAGIIVAYLDFPAPGVVSPNSRTAQFASENFATLASAESASDSNSISSFFDESDADSWMASPPILVKGKIEGNGMDESPKFPQMDETELENFQLFDLADMGTPEPFLSTSQLVSSNLISTTSISGDDSQVSSPDITMEPIRAPAVFANIVTSLVNQGSPPELVKDSVETSPDLSLNKFNDSNISNLQSGFRGDFGAKPDGNLKEQHFTDIVLCPVPKLTTESSFGGNDLEIEDSSDISSFDEDEDDAMIDHLLANDQLEDLEDTEDLADDCRSKLFKSTSLWIKTALLLLEFDKSNHLAPGRSPKRIRFSTDQGSWSSGSDSLGSPESMMETVSRTNSKGSQTSASLAGQASTSSGVPTELDSVLSHIGEKSTDEEARVLRTIVNNYRRVFLHLQRNVVLPCNRKIMHLIKDILAVGNMEAGVHAWGSGIANELGIVSEILEENGEIDCAYWHIRLEECRRVLGNMDARLKTLQADISALQTGIATRIKDIIDNITRIRAMRERILKKYFLFYDHNHSQGSFGLQEVHQYTHVNEYKKSTIWHAHVDVDGLKSLLTEDMNALVTNNDSVRKMMKSIHEGLGFVKKAMCLYESMQQYRLSVEVIAGESPHTGHDSALERNYSMDSAAEDSNGKKIKRRRRRNKAKKNKRSKNKR